MMKKDSNPCLIWWILLFQENALEIHDNEGVEKSITDTLSCLLEDCLDDHVLDDLPLDDSLSCNFNVH